MKLNLQIDRDGQVDWQGALVSAGISLLAEHLLPALTRPAPRPDDKTMMTIEKKYRRLAQALANQMQLKGRRPLQVDGVIGPLSRQRFALLTAKPASWPARRLTAAIFQKLSNGALVSDGWWGPLTEAVAEKLYLAANNRRYPVRPDEDPDKKVKRGRRKVKCWRPSDQQMIDFYGRPGTNQKTIRLPYAVKLAWSQEPVTRTTVHQKAAGPFQGALEMVAETYDEGDRAELGLDQFGGCLNVRRKRGGSTWSAHAFGAASDWDPDRNKLRWHKDRASFAGNDFKEWRKAWSDAGFMSLGVCYDFDWMHWQLNPF